MATLSAGTYDYKVCVGCDESGTTVVSFVEAPHPVYTDGFNNTIVQTTAVALGGFNGLNN